MRDKVPDVTLRLGNVGQRTQSVNLVLCGLPRQSSERQLPTLGLLRKADGRRQLQCRTHGEESFSPRPSKSAPYSRESHSRERMLQDA